MSESQKKFSYFAPDANAHSQKALRVDAVAEAKDNVTSVTRALSLGKMPTTDQITEALTTARNARTLRDEVQLSESGQQVSDKFDQVLDSTRRLVLDKNRGNEIQNLIYHSKLAEKNLDKKTPSFKAERGDTKEDLNNAYSHLLILSRLIITSSQFRGLLADFYSLIRETLVMNDVNYSRDLPSVAELTDDQGGLDAALAKESARRLTKDLKDEIYDNLDEESRNHLDRARSGQKKHVAIDLAHKGAQELAKSIKPVVDKASEGNTVDAANMTQHKAKKINHRAQSSKDKYKVRAEEFADKADDKLQDIYKDLRLTDVEKDQLIERLISIINEIQTNKEMQKAIDGLIEVLANLKSTSQIIKDKTLGKAQNEAESNEDLEYAVANAKRAIENFAGHHSLDPLIKMVSNFANEVDSNSELSNVMHKNHVFLLSSLKDPSFTKQNNYDEIALERFQETRKLLLGVKYQQKVRELMGELRSLIVDIKEDPLTNRAITDLEHLTSEMFLDKNGRPTIKYDLLQDFHKFVPALSKRLRRIKIPRVEEQDNHGEYILDNIFLECDNIVPAQARVRTDTQFDSGEEYIQNVISIQLQGVKAEAKDVAFYFNRKVSILGNMEDSGLVNVSVGGDGLDIFLKIAPKTISVNKNLAPVDTRAFRILDLTCRVNDIRVSFQFGKYNILYRMFNRMIQNNVKRGIEKMVVEGIRNFLEGVEENITNPDAKLGGTKCDPKPMNNLNEGWKTDIFGKN